MKYSIVKFLKFLAASLLTAAFISGAMDADTLIGPSHDPSNMEIRNISYVPTYALGHWLFDKKDNPENRWVKMSNTQQQKLTKK